MWKYSQGRWNRHLDYACLYTALTRDGALAELDKQRHDAGSAVGDRDLVSIDIEVVEPVLDLTDYARYEQIALAAGETPNLDLLTADGPAAYEHCQKLADAARARGFTALRVPSAAARGEINLAIYFDVVAPKHLRIDNGPDRERITPPS